MQIEYAVILCFDESFSNRIRSIWNQFNYYASDPHITLADFTEINPEQFTDDLIKFFNGIKPIKIKFNSIGCFPKSNTIFLAPTINQKLWSLHQKFHKAFKKYPHKADSYYLPESWVPHCTIKSRAKVEEICGIIEYLSNNFTFDEVSVKSVKLVQLFYEDNKMTSNRIIQTINLDDKKE